MDKRKIWRVFRVDVMHLQGNKRPFPELLWRAAGQWRPQALCCPMAMTAALGLPLAAAVCSRQSVTQMRLGVRNTYQPQNGAAEETAGRASCEQNQHLFDASTQQVSSQ